MATALNSFRVAPLIPPFIPYGGPPKPKSLRRRPRRSSSRCHNEHTYEDRPREDAVTICSPSPADRDSPESLLARATLWESLDDHDRDDSGNIDLIERVSNGYPPDTGSNLEDLGVTAHITEAGAESFEPQPYLAVGTTSIMPAESETGVYTNDMWGSMPTFEGDCGLGSQPVKTQEKRKRSTSIDTNSLRKNVSDHALGDLVGAVQQAKRQCSPLLPPPTCAGHSSAIELTSPTQAQSGLDLPAHRAAGGSACEGGNDGEGTAGRCIGVPINIESNLSEVSDSNGGHAQDESASLDKNARLSVHTPSRLGQSYSHDTNSKDTYTSDDHCSDVDSLIRSDDNAGSTGTHRTCRSSFPGGPMAVRQSSLSGSSLERLGNGESLHDRPMRDIEDDGQGNSLSRQNLARRSRRRKTRRSARYSHTTTGLTNERNTLPTTLGVSLSSGQPHKHSTIERALSERGRSNITHSSAEKELELISITLFAVSKSTFLCTATVRGDSSTVTPAYDRSIMLVEAALGQIWQLDDISLKGVMPGSLLLTGLMHRPTEMAQPLIPGEPTKRLIGARPESEAGTRPRQARATVHYANESEYSNVTESEWSDKSDTSPSYTRTNSKETRGSMAQAHRKWSELDERRLCALVKEGMPWKSIFGIFPNRTPGAVRTRWHMLREGGSIVSI